MSTLSFGFLMSKVRVVMPTQAPKASDVVGAQIITFTQPCKYIHLFVLDPETNTGFEKKNKTESLYS